MKILPILLGLLLVNSILSAQERKFTISGIVHDNDNGEDLIGVSVGMLNSGLGTTTNSYGFYSISLPVGEHIVRFSYIGYASKEVKVDLSEDRKLNISLESDAQQLQEVVVSSQSKNANVSNPEMSIEKLSAKTIKAIPALMGEVDVIKAIQLLPGVQATSEGSSGFSVRGGGYDQNLIMLDEATVYSASHLVGFFSVFNNDAIKDVVLYKGDIPASAGGRLSSLMDIRSKDGNNQRFSGTGGIGLISSRLTLEGPILSDKATFIVSGRRTYADLFLRLANNPDVRNTNLYFYDMNAKLSYRINDNNRLFLSGYLGRDELSSDNMGLNFGNLTTTLRWNHIFSPKLFSNFTFIGSDYDYSMGSSSGTSLMQEWTSKIRDFGFKADFSYHPNPQNSIKFGYHATHHTFTPSEGGSRSNSISAPISLPEEFALEHAAYLSNDMQLSNKLTIKYGLRYSMFHTIANGETIDYLTDYKVDYSKTLAKGEIYNYQHRLEPRAGITYVFNNANSVKASYSRTAQYIQLASNSTAGSPLDVWFPASQNVKPQLSDQFSLGYFRNFAENSYEFSAEAYYKNLQDVVDFKDHANLLGNADLEQELRFGKGRAYGLELMLKKNSDKLTGWVSYTIAHARRQVDEINNGAWYRSPYDKPHNISIVANYELSRKWSLGANWVYASGSPVTYPTGKYVAEGSNVPLYSGRNEYRYPAYHRLDLSATVKLSKPEKKFKSELNFSLYNAYGRKNPWMIMFRQDENQPDVTYAEKMYMFTFIPSITWNFTF
ncbi:TonB-dependent receptor SusC [termite gut metagenome]|uniref:TonB-dependent receptor SusC n=2 Tax=termite gut metagenome TaxID=433724 RepID=A0A5J4S3K9_9ZZZZ